MTNRIYEIYYKIGCGSFLYTTTETLEKARTKAKNLPFAPGAGLVSNIWINVCEIKKIRRIKVR